MQGQLKEATIGVSLAIGLAILKVCFVIGVWHLMVWFLKFLGGGICNG